MTHHLILAAGYFTIFLPFVLLTVGQGIGAPYLAAAVIFGVGPLSRILLGNVADEMPEWDEATSTFLDRLPSAYAIAFPLLMGLFLFYLNDQPPRGTAAWVGLGLSLWTCLFFAVVVAHELIHQGGSRRRLGWLLAGAAGYPWLAHEHLPHHGTSGNVVLAEWPRRDESVWSFVLRRSLRVFHSALEHNAIIAARRRRGPIHGGLPEAFAATAATGAAIGLVAGGTGLVLYLCVVAGVHFGVQAVTYLQHWGLGVDSVVNAEEGRFAWEDRCQFQVWLMLHLALHHAHHRNSGLPYYRLSPHPASPRLPAGYVLLLIASFIPPVWKWLMVPALERWKEDPFTHVEPARWRLICLPAHYHAKAQA